MKNIENGVFMKTDFVSMGEVNPSGKGTGIVIPHRFDFKKSMIVLDPKREHQKNQPAF
jgi:type IV secretory pathway TraG/TraD family ATPase VirD4